MYNFKEEFVKAVLIHGKSIGAGLATIGLAGAGVGAGLVFASMVFSISRNPSNKNEIFKYAMLGFALTEAVGLLCFMMAIIILFG